MIVTFKQWFDLWDTTGDPEVRRLCEISWKTALCFQSVTDCDQTRKAALLGHADGCDAVSPGPNYCGHCGGYIGK
jgi:hypothetical protein